MDALRAPGAEGCDGFAEAGYVRHEGGGGGDVDYLLGGG